MEEEERNNSSETKEVSSPVKTKKRHVERRVNFGFISEISFFINKYSLIKLIYTI